MCARVVAAVSSEGKALAGAQAGADRTLVYPLDLSDRAVAKSLADDFKSAVGPHGAQVVFDPGGGAYAAPALRSLAWEGRYRVLGFTAGIPRVPLHLAPRQSRSEERRVGTACVSQCRSRWSSFHKKHK